MNYTLIGVYTDMLAAAGLSADERGYVSSDFGDREPVHINGNRLVLPTNFQLRENVHDNERIVFHPLSENVIRPEPLVVKKLRTNINMRLNQAFGIIGQSLLQLVASPALHRRLNPQQLQLLTSVHEVDEKTAHNFSLGVIGLMKEGADRALTHIFLCRGGMKNAKKYARMGVVTFPIYKRIEDGEFGKLRQKDKEPILQLLEFMFPGSSTPDEWSVGSDSTIAPFLEALFNSAAPLMLRVNELVELYEEFIPFDDTITKETLTFNMNWTHTLSNLEDFAAQIRSVPPQNDGPIVTAEVPAAPSSPTAPIHQQLAPGNPTAPVAAPATPAQAAKTKEGLDFNTLMATAHAAAAPQYPVGMVPVMMPAGMMPPGYAPGGMVPPGWQQQPQRRPEPSWAQLPPTQQMVQTPQGMMTLAAAMQFGVPYQMLPPGFGPQPGMQPTMGPGGPGNFQTVGRNPNW